MKTKIIEAQVAVQCVHPDTGEIGAWLFIGDSHRKPGSAVSPVFPDCYTLFKEFTQPNGWVNSLGGSYFKEVITEVNT